MKGYYGSKCVRCAHADGSTHEIEPAPWLGVVTCPRCSFCQGQALHTVLLGGGLDLFDSNVRDAVRALRDGQEHPLLNKLRRECQALEQTLEFMGEEWTVVDAQDDDQHWHLTLVRTHNGATS